MEVDIVRTRCQIVAYVILPNSVEELRIELHSKRYIALNLIASLKTGDTMLVFTMLLTIASICGAKSACGFKGVDSGSGRIVGGHAVGSSAEWPWMTKLLIKKKDAEGNETNGFCGGSLVAPHWVLTAAHCLEGLVSVRVRIGIPIDRPRDEQFGHLFMETVFPQNVFIHPNFSRTAENKQGDIGLIRLLKTPNRRQKNIDMACLPPVNMPINPERKCVAIGYGNAQLGSPPLVRILKQTTLEVMSQRECHAKLLGDVCQDMKDLICTIDYDSGSGLCSADSGSPILVQGSDQKWYVVGVHSRGRYCGDTVYPKLAIKVTHYLKWIKDTITSNRVIP